MRPCRQRGLSASALSPQSAALQVSGAPVELEEGTRKVTWQFHAPSSRRSPSLSRCVPRVRGGRCGVRQRSLGARRVSVRLGGRLQLQRRPGNPTCFAPPCTAHSVLARAPSRVSFARVPLRAGRVILRGYLARGTTRARPSKSHQEGHLFRPCPAPRTQKMPVHLGR